MDDLTASLRAADPGRLVEIIRRRRSELGPDSVRQALRNSYADAAVIEELLGDRRLRSYYEVRREIASHPRTPQVRAQGLIVGLYWRDLLRIGADSRIKPAVRRAADRCLADRLGRLSMGEKVVVAREAGQGLIPRLLDEPDVQVVAAVLENPRLTETALARLVTNPVAAPAVLRRIAADRRWGSRYSTQRALCRNPATPPALAISLLPSLTKPDRRAIAADRRVRAAVRERASVLSE
jgi:hypothetical protein